MCYEYDVNVYLMSITFYIMTYCIIFIKYKLKEIEKIKYL